ncbi:MAG: DUF2975 domain-containing protein [Eubacteriales bacterium]|nr:DUF2975 domain-containing protein [Eubacteriales bacterium]
MNQRKLSLWLKAVVVGCALCGLVIYLGVFPMIGKDTAAIYPEFAYCLWPWLLFLWITAVPCYIALVVVWRMAGEIGSDNSFCPANARRLKLVAILAAADAAFFFVGNVVFLLLSMTHPGVFLLSFLFVFAGIALSVAAAALSHLVYKGAQLREENDLTI